MDCSGRRAWRDQLGVRTSRTPRPFTLATDRMGRPSRHVHPAALAVPRNDGESRGTLHAGILPCTDLDRVSGLDWTQVKSSQPYSVALLLYLLPLLSCDTLSSSVHWPAHLRVGIGKEQVRFSGIRLHGDGFLKIRQRRHRIALQRKNSSTKKVCAVMARHQFECRFKFLHGIGNTVDARIDR